MKYAILVLFLVSSVFGSELGSELGKLYVDSIPTRAVVSLVDKKMNKPLGVTKCLVYAPLGDQKILIQKSGYEDAVIDVKVEKKGIKRLDVVKLKPTALKTDVLSAEDGWRVFVDGKPAKDVYGEDAVTPCTVAYTSQTKSISIAKEGFRDQTFEIKAGDDLSEVNFKEKPRRGIGVLLGKGKPDKEVSSHLLGVWFKIDTKTKFVFSSDGFLSTSSKEEKFKNGKWLSNGGNVILTFDNEDIELTLNKEELIGNKKGWILRR